jgi:glutamate/tyrosine decarboxylase-like PLP-dependent enzyme
MHSADWRPALDVAHQAALDWLEGLAGRPVRPDRSYAEMLDHFDGPLPELGSTAVTVIEDLAQYGPAGLNAMNHGRFFGWVIGGVHPAGVAADWLATAWDQNTALGEPTPTVSSIEEVTARWVVELVGFRRGASVGFVTGGQLANLVCLAAGRDRVLRDVGWNVADDGLIGGPRVNVVVGDHVHHTVGKALRILGLGERTVIRIPTDDNARMRSADLDDVLGSLDGPTIVCAQAGEVNTGGVDRLADITAVVDRHRPRLPVWLHVDGAIGLWARTSPALAPLFAGLERADSASTDAHKWLNTPYDCGIAMVADPEAHQRAMSLHAEYIPKADIARDPIDWNPEMSRRSRALAVYATIRQLGRQGIAEIVERDCEMARRIADGLSGIDGAEVMNEVELNQVLVRFRDPTGADDDAHTRSVLAAVQSGGVAFPSPTTWKGSAAIRISVCNWATDRSDVDLTVDAFRSAHDSKG